VVLWVIYSLSGDLTLLQTLGPDCCCLDRGRRRWCQWCLRFRYARREARHALPCACKLQSKVCEGRRHQAACKYEVECSLHGIRWANAALADADLCIPLGWYASRIWHHAAVLPYTQAPTSIREILLLNGMEWIHTSRARDWFRLDWLRTAATDPRSTAAPP